MASDLPRALVLVLDGAAHGEQAKVTAARMGLSLCTVNKQRMDAAHRLGARNTTHAVAIAIQTGVLPYEFVDKP